MLRPYKSWRGDNQKWLIWAGIIWWGYIGGCQDKLSSDELIHLIGEYNLADRRRQSVIDEVLSRPLNQSQQKILGQQLSEVIGSPRHSPVIRRRVLSVISQRYQDEAAIWLGAALLNTREPEICRQIIAALAQQKDTHALPYLVIAGFEEQNTHPGPAEWAQKAVPQVADKPLETVLVEQITAETLLRARLAALAGLKRLLDPDQILALVLKLDSNDDFLDSLQFWARRFEYLPANIADFFICQTQQMTLAAPSWDQLQQRVGSIKQKWAYQFDVRDSYVILTATKTDLNQPPEEWARKITQCLAPLSHTKRTPAYPGAPDDYREDFAGRRKLFSYTDLIRMEYLLESLARPEIVDRLRQLVKDDLTDVDTEVGGLCFLDSVGKVVFKPYPPDRRLGDNQYVESPTTTRRGALCLARWHCHANPHRPKELAGPGADDLQFAAYYNCPLVVVTYLNDKMMNVDYCTPQGAVVDLGNY